MSKLNADQVRAASHSAGHAVVLAGPGTGKTSTLIARHRHLLSKGVPPDGMFVVTFTQKAAEEIRGRIGDAAGNRAWIGTFHSHCLRLLKRFSEEAGLPPNFKVADVGGQQKVLREAGVEWNQDDGDLIEMISRWKDAGVDPDAAAADASGKGNATGRMAAECYAKYEDGLRAAGLLDFSDLVARGAKLVANSRAVRTFISKNLKHALVDEFQDVNKTQIELLQAMAEAGTEIWAVGDDDQALYGWRGSNVFYTVHFENYFSPASKYTLGVNYRCDPSVIDVASAVIGNNKHRVRKKITAAKAHRNGVGVRVKAYADEREEAAEIAAAISAFVARGAKQSDIGVLLRTSAISGPIQQALEAEGLGMALTGATSFWDAPEMDAVLHLATAIERGDKRPAFKYKGGADFVDAMNGLPPSRTAVAVGQFLAARPPANANAERIASWADGVEAAAAFAASHSSADALGKAIAERSAKASAMAGDGVNVTTVHSSKGLEYKHVFVPACEAGVMPHRKSTDLEEERRLFYVALTRSIGSVDVTLSRSRAGRKQTPSPFLGEAAAAGQPHIVWVASDRKEAAVQTQPAARQQAPEPAKVAEKRKGLPTVYFRKDGSRTLVPPEE